MAQDTERLNWAAVAAANGHARETSANSAPEAAAADVVVRVRQLVRRFGARTILDHVDLDIRRGEFVALLGHSGCGKSTFLRSLAGLDYDVVGTGSIATPQPMAVVFQDARLLPWKSVLDNVIYGLRGPAPQLRGRETLREVGLEGRESAWPSDLSGGEQQRVALARALVRSPQLLLADEPFGALDALTRLRMHSLLGLLCQRHRPAVLLVTHDVDEAIHLADRILVLNHGRFSIDVPTLLPGRDAATTVRLARIASLRQQLLQGLGVRPDDAPPPEHTRAEKQAIAAPSPATNEAPRKAA
ncbi:MAG: ABC transporter ATP-binding protein [Burkholderiaceae bacterium]|jgi:sulfonate transport system ATP-binding protein|nr:ABC transporter ATP-binding protein [Burkholderiaceae bacterium]